MVSLAETLAARLAPTMEDRLDFHRVPESDHFGVLTAGMDRALARL